MRNTWEAIAAGFKGKSKLGKFYESFDYFLPLSFIGYGAVEGQFALAMISFCLLLSTFVCALKEARVVIWRDAYDELGTLYDRALELREIEREKNDA